MYTRNSDYHPQTQREQLIDTLNRLWIEHVAWTRFFIVSAAFNLPDIKDVTARLLRNPDDFAAVLTPYYGQQGAQQFAGLLKDHLLIAAALVNAAKSGDSKAVEQQRAKWYANADSIAKTLGSINPYWNAGEWQAMLHDHLKMTEDEAVQILQGKYAMSVPQFDSIEYQALKMAKVMSDGIISQFGL